MPAERMLPSPHCAWPLAAALLLQSALAQHFAELRQAPCSVSFGDHQGGIATDVDSNGSIDVLLRRRGALLLGDGQLRFQYSPPGQRIPTQALGLPTDFHVAGDVDLDGFVDLVRGALMVSPLLGTSVHVMPGRPGGTWGNPVLAGFIAGFGAPAELRDVDGDALPDLFVRRVPDNHGFMRNLGNGTFADLTAANLPPGGLAWPMAFLDADGDGDIDLVDGGAGGVRLLANDGAGVFSVRPASGLPNAANVALLRCADADGDGDADLLLAAAPGALLQLWTNGGGGTFALAAAAVLPAHGRSTTFRDLDGDGDADLLLVTDPSPRQQLQAWRNLGAMVFTPLPAHTIDDARDDFGDPELADLEADGDLDVVLGGGLFFVDDGNQVYAPLQREAVPVNPGATTLVAGDLDGDGDVDLVHGGAVFHGDGDGHFATTTQTLPAGGTSRALFDADGDGDLDLAWTALDTAMPGGVMLNQSGVLAALPALPHGQLRGRVVAADFDGDGLLDLCSQSGVLLRNLGGGAFAPAGTGVPGGGPLAAGDFDRDGRIDLAVGTSSGWTQWRNLGGFAFQAVGTGSIAFRAVASGDIDGDGDVDLVSSFTSSSFGGSFFLFVVWQNQGGLFSQGAVQIDGSHPCDAAVLADLDEDGDLDYVGNHAWRNDGTGGFAALGTQFPFTDPTVADVDGDGDGDVLRSGSGGDRAIVLVNRLRQISAPFVPVLGWPYDLSMSSRPDNPGGDVVVAAVAFARIAPVVVPGLGALHIDPWQAVFAPPASTGPASDFTWSTFVPNAPALAGLPVFWQGLVFDGAGLRLTGFFGDRLVP